MSINKINVEVTQETEDQVLQNIEASTEPLDFLIKLQTLERIRLAKMGRKDLGFVERALMHATDNPQYLNNYVTIDDFGKDVGTAKCLRRFNAATDSLKERINDTRLLVESEAYATARVYYKAVKAAAQVGVPGAEAIAADLSVHYKKRSSKKEEKTNIEPPTEQS